MQVLQVLLMTAADKPEMICYKTDDEHVEVDSMCNECVQRITVNTIEEVVKRCNAINRILDNMQNNTNQVKADHNAL